MFYKWLPNLSILSRDSSSRVIQLTMRTGNVKKPSDLLLYYTRKYSSPSVEIKGDRKDKKLLARDFSPNLSHSSDF